MKMKKRQRHFSFRKDGPLVEELYRNGKSISAIAKELSRGYRTIKNYLEYKNLTEAEVKNEAVDITDEDLTIGNTYFSTRQNANVKLKGFYKGNCRVYNPKKFAFGYCKPEELIQRRI